MYQEFWIEEELLTRETKLISRKDLLLSLEIELSNTLNYLAYTWIEQNKKIKEALSMLEKANNLKKNDGYITDSWVGLNTNLRI